MSPPSCPDCTSEGHSYPFILQYHVTIVLCRANIFLLEAKGWIARGPSPQCLSAHTQSDIDSDLESTWNRFKYTRVVSDDELQGDGESEDGSVCTLVICHP